MAVLIDSSILIEAERGRLTLDPHVTEHGEAEVFLSVVSASELLHGVHRACDAEQRARRSAFVEALLERFPVVDLDLVCARAHSLIWSELATAGNMIGSNDVWLAATCIAHGLTLVTANVRDFERIRGLQIEVWADVDLGSGVR